MTASRHRRLAMIVAAGALLMQAGCVVYEPVPVPQATPQQRFDRAWAAAGGALSDQGITIMQQDRASGTIRGLAGTISVAAIVQTQADGNVEVRFEIVGAKDMDPGLSQRLTDSYLRRNGR
jgi:peptidoglycan/LPS O-acetylase OafA/YrhL